MTDRQGKEITVQELIQQNDELTDRVAELESELHARDKEHQKKLAELRKVLDYIMVNALEILVRDKKKTES